MKSHSLSQTLKGFPDMPGILFDVAKRYEMSRLICVRDSFIDS
jgi:hypothetical protein